MEGNVNYGGVLDYIFNLLSDSYNKNNTILKKGEI